jgi:hypothetical protein
VGARGAGPEQGLERRGRIKAWAEAAAKRASGVVISWISWILQLLWKAAV